jgi:hypothetical protein
MKLTGHRPIGPLSPVSCRNPPYDGAGAGPPRPGPDVFDQAMSNRSRFMTLTQAATKSVTNFSFASSLA